MSTTPTTQRPPNVETALRQGWVRATVLWAVCQSGIQTTASLVEAIGRRNRDDIKQAITWLTHNKLLLQATKDQITILQPTSSGIICAQGLNGYETYLSR